MGYIIYPFTRGNKLKISHHDRKNYNKGIFLNNEGTCFSLWLMIYKENDQVNFGIEVRIVGLSDLAYRNDGPTIILIRNYDWDIQVYFTLRHSTMTLGF